MKFEKWKVKQMEWFHGGDPAGYEQKYGKNLLDFSANVSPLGMPAGARRAAENAIHEAVCYPDPFCRALREALSVHLDFPSEYILCGNGASDLIWRLTAAIRPKRALLPAPAFSEYQSALSFYGCQVKHFVLRKEDDFTFPESFIDQITPDIDVIFLCQPNNPTGRTMRPGLLRETAEKCKKTQTLLVLDECFLEFLEEAEKYSLLPLLRQYAGSGSKLWDYPVLIIRAFTKFYGMAGLRLGYCVCADRSLLDRMRQAGPPWPVSNAAQAAGIAALEDHTYPLLVRKSVSAQRRVLTTVLQESRLRVIPGEANFLLFQGDEGLGERLLERGILVRDCSNFPGLSKGWYRIAVKTEEENRRLIAAIDAVQRG